jgi:uncharacterized integral membrane protein
MGRLRERWRDPLLTIVTILILFMLFVAPPLEAIDLRLIHVFAFVVTLAVIVSIFVMSGNLIAVIAMANRNRHGRRVDGPSPKGAINTRHLSPSWNVADNGDYSGLGSGS